MRLREAEHQVHVVLDEQHGDVLGQRRHRGEDFVAVFFGHAGGGLVEQQHARPARQRERDLEQPLLAVGQRRNGLVHRIGQVKPLEHARDILVEAEAAAGDAPPVAAAAEPLRHRQPDGFERREIAEQLVDLEGARQAQAHAAVRREPRDIPALEQDRCPRSGGAPR